MQVRKIAATAVLGGGISAMALAGAGFASASPSQGTPNHPVANSISNTIHSFNTVNKDDHSTNTAILSGNTINMTVKVVVFNGNSLLSGNSFFNGSLNGNKVGNLNGNKVGVLNGAKVGNLIGNLNGNKVSNGLLSPRVNPLVHH